MALQDLSLFLYGLVVTELNRSLDFRIAPRGTPNINMQHATVDLGYYSLTTLAEAIVRAMTEADPEHFYTVNVDRTVGGGLQNRISIETDSDFLELCFGQGVDEDDASDRNFDSSIASLIGFRTEDYTGATTYTGAASAGISLVPSRIGYAYKPAAVNKKNPGSVNVAASGVTECVTWGVTSFFGVRFQYIQPYEVDPWAALMEWAIAKRPLEFTPEICKPDFFHNAILESTQADNNGLGFELLEMLPNMPGIYDTGALKFRVS